MTFRPVAFSIPSTTELKVTFSQNVSESLTVSNFGVSSLSGATNDLEVTGIAVDNKIITISTKPQVSGSYYLLKFLDTDEQIFRDERGARLLDDSVSRELFFVGIENINPVRDRLFDSIPSLFELEDTNIKNILSAQAEELYKAQKYIGRALSDNYISIEIEDELRTRTAGAYDRMANENAYEIVRVSKNPTNTSPIYSEIDYTSNNSLEELQSLPYFPISLQQEIIVDEEISSSTTNNNFDGFLLTPSKSNIIRLLSVRIVRPTDVADCDGNLGTEYDVEQYKYTIKDNKYDNKNAFSFATLDDDQILLSEFGNINRPTSLDTIYITYIYKDTKKYIIEDTISASRVEIQQNESVPSNSSNFFLDHAPIVNASNEVLSSGGVSFKLTENSSTAPSEFLNELNFDSSKLPSRPGEYTVNYETGEVILVGEAIGVGTGRNNYLVDYNYRKEFAQDVDYSVDGQDFVGHPNREIIKEEVEISFNYDSIYQEGVDYEGSSHIEVQAEQVKNKLTSSFSLTTENAPITDVYRILNQTTGEIYNLLYHTDTEINFSGNRSPEIVDVESEIANFDRVTNEELTVIGSFITPTFDIRITSVISNNNIQFSPGIPAELLSVNSTDYFARLTTSGDEISVEDLQIRFFGPADGNNLISSFAISPTASPPTSGSNLSIGTKAYIIYLDENGVLNNNKDGIGNLVNTSISFSESDTFLNEKHFEPISSVSGVESVTNGTSLSVAITSEKTDDFYINLSRLRKAGDYCVDYSNGIIYLSVSENQDIFVGKVDYSYNESVAKNSNIFNAQGASKRVNSAESLYEADIVYDSLTNDTEKIKILDLEDSLTIWDGETLAADLDGNKKIVAQLLEDYTVVVPYNIKKINTINLYENLTGSGLDEELQANRSAEVSAQILNTSVRSGGKNLYDNKTVGFTNNVIDLKTRKDKRAYKNLSGDYEVVIYDDYATSIYDVTLSKTGATLFDEKLNITKISDIKVLSTSAAGGSAIVYMSTDFISDIDTSEDFLLDIDGNRFEITSIDTTLSTLTVNSPAINNPAALVPTLDQNGEGTEIVVKPIITVANGSMTIIIPADAPINLGDLLEIKYLTSILPPIGSRFAIDYRFGFIYLDYSYIKDRLAIWYEYGDNAIDWSIGSAISEGENYYVSYRYGASRDALQTNFGGITNIPFFRNFSLNTDRELYRKALKGTLQAFAKGPTIPAYEELIKSFTDINPEITEKIFGSWILGRDYLYTGIPKFSGLLEFEDGRFEDGLYFQDKTTVSVPSVSGLSIEEGTVETWIRPKWSGIDNDATLTFNIENIGIQKYILNRSDDPTKNGWSFLSYNESDIAGRIDTTGSGFRLSNFETQGGLKPIIGNFGLNMTESKDLSILDDYNGKFRFKIPFYGLSHENISDTFILNRGYKIADIAFSDSERTAYVRAGLTRALDFNFIVNPSNTTVEDLPDYDRLHYLRSCTCTIDNNVSILSGFNDPIVKIDLSTPINILSMKNLANFIDDKPSLFVLINKDGRCYEVVSVLDPSGQAFLTSLPNLVSSIYVKRFAINYQSITQGGAVAINDSNPLGEFNLYAKNLVISTKSSGSSDSAKAFSYEKSHIIDWQTSVNIEFTRTIDNNLVDYRINNSTIERMFWTDLPSTEPYLINRNITDLSTLGFMIILHDEIHSSVDIEKVSATIIRNINLNDIYIGINGYHPRSIPFSVNKEDHPLTPIGMPKEAEDQTGIFIWYDDLCTSPLTSSAGQWIFRNRGARTANIPTLVIFDQNNNYTIISALSEEDQVISGNILTSGEFSSVVSASREETLGGCINDNGCEASFRYCGGHLLEDSGWVRLEETSSTLINTIIGGTETQYDKWTKIGDFTTSESNGVYRMESGTIDECNEHITNHVYSHLLCDGNLEFTISAKVVQVDNNIINSGVGIFSGALSGVITGIVPIHIASSDIDMKLMLGLSNTNEPLILVYDVEAGTVIDYISYNWNDNSYHEYVAEVDKSNRDVLDIYVDNLLLSRISLDDFETPSSSNKYFGIYIFDNTFSDLLSFNAINTNNIIDIDLIQYEAANFDGEYKLESTDILIPTDSRVDFRFYIDSLDVESDAYDAYDAYDGYDGYLEALIGVDEIFMTSDNLRYILDTASDDNDGRISIFKDGKGFLNFRVFDNSLSNKKEVGVYNIATNIKHFVAGELHHVAASWKLNSINDRDEMHLFLDGIEVPNIYRFGGSVPVKVDTKFSDVSKETLQNFLNKDIEYCLEYTGGTTVAGSSLFSSPNIYFTDDMIGRSILMTSSILAPTFIGKEYIIKSTSNGSAVFGRGSSLDVVSFNTSTTDIEFKFPPTAGILSSVLTDVKNSRFSIFKTAQDEVITEFGGILYEVENGSISIVGGENINKPKFRANVNTKIIEFIGEDSSCNTVPTVNMSDIDIHIETYGLSLQKFYNTTSLSTSSYRTDSTPLSGKSALKIYGTEPIHLQDVSITRVPVDKVLLDSSNTTTTVVGPDNIVTFSINMDQEINKVSSQSGRISKQNLGRYLSMWFDSDNVIYCEYDGYDGYDGYLDSSIVNFIKVIGETIDGVDEEYFSINKNGLFEGNKLFTKIDRIEGELLIADPNYFEVGLVSFEESDSIMEINNGGDVAELFDYESGNFILTVHGSNGLTPFELHPGSYKIEYPTYLNIPIDETGHDLCIGSDYNGNNSFNGVIDEFRVISEMSSDTKTYETYTSGTRSITRDYNAVSPFCADQQTLTLIHFNNPIAEQNRRLRTAEFLDEEDNYKYKLTTAQRESLLKLISDESSFVKQMILWGFSNDQANKIYNETLYAENGPIKNDSKYYNNFAELTISSDSVNDAFGKSAFFREGRGLLLTNDSEYFRAKKGTIEFWVSPLIDTRVDQDIKTYIDISTAAQERVTSTLSTIIELPNSAKKILSIKLLTSAARFENLYSSAEEGLILFDEIYRSTITGRLTGGTGTEKDFSIGAKLSANGQTVYLKEALPGNNIDVVISYIPIDIDDDKISIYKNEHSQIVFGIRASGIDHVVTANVDWNKNSWHRVVCTYKTGTATQDSMRIYVDGDEGGIIRYGTGLIYGTGYIYGQYNQRDGLAKSKKYKIELGSNFRTISIGSDAFGANSARARMDNIRFSRILRDTIKDSNNNFIDTNYSSNLNTILPVVNDDATTLLINFDEDEEMIENFATVIDPVRGIFDFDIEVIDNFSKVIDVDDGNVEDLIIELVDKLKPAHTNALVKFTKSKC